MIIMIGLRTIYDAFRGGGGHKVKHGSGGINLVEVKEDGFRGFLCGDSEGQGNIIINIIESK